MTLRAEGGPITVLIVDDYEPLRSLLCRLFSHYSDLLVVGCAGTGEEAIDLALVHVPAVIVMDVDMPGIGGVEATRRLVVLLPGIRIVAYSAADYSRPMQAAGAVAYVTKGSPPAELLAAIRQRPQPDYTGLA